MQQPKIIGGNSSNDIAGTINFNNSFDVSEIKRMYLINNRSMDFLRVWQCHQIEQLWVSSLHGSFCFKLIKIDNWELSPKNLKCLEFSIYK